MLKITRKRTKCLHHLLNDEHLYHVVSVCVCVCVCLHYENNVLAQVMTNLFCMSSTTKLKK